MPRSNAPTFACDAPGCDATWTGETAQLPPGWCEVTAYLTDAAGLQSTASGVYCPDHIASYLAAEHLGAMKSDLSARAAASST